MRAGGFVPRPPIFTLVLPADRYLLAPDLKLPTNTRFSGGVDQQLSKSWRVGVL